MSSSDPVVCAFCGATPASDESGAVQAGPRPGETAVPPLTWTTAVENGRTRYFCATCSRENLRAIESKLDSEWW